MMFAFSYSEQISCCFKGEILKVLLYDIYPDPISTSSRYLDVRVFLSLKQTVI